MEDAENNAVKTNAFSLNKNTVVRMIYRFNFMNRWYIFAGIYALLALYHAAVIVIGQGTNIYFIVFISVMYAVPILGLAFSFLLINKFLTKSSGRIMIDVCNVKIMPDGICFFTKDNTVHFVKTEKIYRLAEYKKYLLIFFSSHIFIPIPLLAFEVGDKQRAIEMLKAKNIIYSGELR